MLREWLNQPPGSPSVPLFVVVAMGGMGKSALTWQFFRTLSDNEPSGLAGRIWWSFYETEATYRNFIIHALSYVSETEPEVVRCLPFRECESRLLNALDSKPFLIVLDGLERLLGTYWGRNVEHFVPDDWDAKQFSQRDRQAVDISVSYFLQRLTTLRSSRIIISSRLFPAALEGPTGDPIPGLIRCNLGGLADEGALELWQTFGLRGTAERLQPLFSRFENHPLLIQALAGRIALDRRTPRDFDAWRRNNPAFDPFSLPLVQVKSHVLQFAVQELTKAETYVLRTIAACHSPVTYTTLCACFVGSPPRLFPDEVGLVTVLQNLENRGLIGWDSRPNVNRYDMHPVVRGVIMSGISPIDRHGIYGVIEQHFRSIPPIPEDNVKSLEDLLPSLELFYTKVGIGHYDSAFDIFQERLDRPLLYLLNLSRQRGLLIEQLFPDGLDSAPRGIISWKQAYLLNALGQSQQQRGFPSAAVLSYRRAIPLLETGDDSKHAFPLHFNLADALRAIADLRGAELSALRALSMARVHGSLADECLALLALAQLFDLRGAEEAGAKALQRALRLTGENVCRKADRPLAQFILRGRPIVTANTLKSRVYCLLAQRSLWKQRFDEASKLANAALDFAEQTSRPLERMRALRIKGMAALKSSDFAGRARARDYFHQCIECARECSLAEEEVAAVLSLAQMALCEEDLERARELLTEVRAPIAQGPFPLLLADMNNLFAVCERIAGRPDAAVAAAYKAHMLAWGVGPPFTYNAGVVAALDTIRKLKAPMPEGLVERPPSGELEQVVVELDPADLLDLDSEEQKGARSRLAQHITDGVGDSQELASLFTATTEQTFLERLGIGDPDMIAYLASLLGRLFFRKEKILHIVTSRGASLEAVADALLEAEGLSEGGHTRRNAYRAIGDVTLFLTGCFPEQLRGGGILKYDHFVSYCEEGKRAYYIASTFEEGIYKEEAPVLRRLSNDFELCAYGLNEVRRMWERQSAPAQPEKRFLVN